MEIYYLKVLMDELSMKNQYIKYLVYNMIFEILRNSL